MPLEVTHLVGLDLGQVNDHTTVVSLRREKVLPDEVTPRTVAGKHELSLLDDKPRPEPAVPEPARYYCNIAERFDKGIPYTTIVENVGKLFQDLKFSGRPLVVDGTGVGRPVVDLFRRARINCRLVPVTITAGGPMQSLGPSMKIDEWGYWHVPKKELVGTVQVLLGTGRIEVAPGLRHAGTLIHELKNFSYKINSATAHVTLEAWRERDHDDLVLALALAAWYGEKARQELWVL